MLQMCEWIMDKIILKLLQLQEIIFKVYGICLLFMTYLYEFMEESVVM